VTSGVIHFQWLGVKYSSDLQVRIMYAINVIDLSMYDY